MGTEPRPAGPTIRVRGAATAQEVAAVVAALGDDAPSTPRRVAPAWLRAGLREGLGERPVSEPSDLR